MRPPFVFIAGIELDLGAAWRHRREMACAVTALPILILFMEKLEILRQPVGQRILRYASTDDVAIWGVLALILMDWTRIGRQALFLPCLRSPRGCSAN